MYPYTKYSLYPAKSCNLSGAVVRRISEVTHAILLRFCTIGVYIIDLLSKVFDTIIFIW